MSRIDNLPIETRFPVNRKDHTQKGPYLVPLLKRLLNKKTNIADPEVQRILRGKVGDKRITFKAIIMLRLILNATQGENEAIKEILNRIDGKQLGMMLDQSLHTHITKYVIVRPARNERENTEVNNPAR